MLSITIRSEPLNLNLIHILFMIKVINIVNTESEPIKFLFPTQAYLKGVYLNYK